MSQNREHPGATTASPVRDAEEVDTDADSETTHHPSQIVVDREWLAALQATAEGQDTTSGKEEKYPPATPSRTSRLVVEQPEGGGGQSHPDAGSVPSNRSIQPSPGPGKGNPPSGSSSVMDATPGASPAAPAQLSRKRPRSPVDEQGDDADEDKLPHDKHHNDNADGEDNDNADGEEANQPPAKKQKMGIAPTYLIVQVRPNKAAEIMAGSAHSPVTIGIEKAWSVADGSDARMAELLGPTIKFDSAILQCSPQPQRWVYERASNFFRTGYNTIRARGAALSAQGELVNQKINNVFGI
ncbi:hypothetical protein P171DRAFT_477974 [Karstenula rhodostoma CBS 690.94]|uniref:Uncharacterized protein n=1 Tax=Karstenula rhodostoma CBS 690.94 TaxID=1392251 RepID=A0A9P4P694_9PLEO|nr:hypothetical protein P171DRAFT_477974 [Karstenula rhodostoma CBS 690.94]